MSLMHIYLGVLMAIVLPCFAFVVLIWSLRILLLPLQFVIWVFNLDGNASKSLPKEATHGNPYQ